MLQENVLWLILLCPLIGALVGLLAGLLGIGGGLIIVPCLIFMFDYFLKLPLDLAMPLAVGTSLGTILFTGLSSALSHYRLGNLTVDMARWSSTGVATGAILGAQLATTMSGQQLKQVFAILAVIICIKMIFSTDKGAEKTASKMLLALVGLITGLISALMGMGGGAIMVPLLVWFGVSIRLAIGCAAFSGILIALFGGANFIWAGWQQPGLPWGSLGYIYLPACVAISIISVFTARLGAKISARADTRRLKQIFAAFLIIVCIRMLFG